MKYYLFKKYWKGTVAFVLLYYLSCQIESNHDDAMLMTVCLFMFGWFIHLMVVLNGNPQKMVIAMDGLFLVLRAVWYVVSLQPLRHWLLRLWYVGLRPDYYPWLALYGNLLDTHVMKHKFSAAFARDKTPVARAALWRLLARGAVKLAARRAPAEPAGGQCRLPRRAPSDDEGRQPRHTRR